MGSAERIINVNTDDRTLDEICTDLGAKFFIDEERLREMIRLQMQFPIRLGSYRLKIVHPTELMPGDQRFRTLIDKAACQHLGFFHFAIALLTAEQYDPEQFGCDKLMLMHHGIKMPRLNGKGERTHRLFVRKKYEDEERNVVMSSYKENNTRILSDIHLAFLVK